MLESPRARTGATAGRLLAFGIGLLAFGVAGSASATVKHHHFHQDRKLAATAFLHRNIIGSPTDPLKDAALIVDGATGKELYARNADAERHPASLTKMMTLYMLFDALKKGEVNMATPFRASAHAAAQKPTKLFLKPGDTIPVDMAIQAVVVLSANDVAVTIAENLAGSEDRFAQLMTAKARQLGMTHTFYHNASGLPDPQQITTARDLAILAHHLAYDYPQYYHYFSTVSFTWRGIPHMTHDNLIGRYEGADGMKTGYTGASGFNLVSSVVRGGAHVIGVVMGGYTARSRDKEMMRLLDTTFASINSNPTLVARATVPWQQLAQNNAPQPVIAGFDPTPAAAVAPKANASDRQNLFAMMGGQGQMFTPPPQDNDNIVTPKPSPVPSVVATPKPAPEITVATANPTPLVTPPSHNDSVGEGDIDDDAVAKSGAAGPRIWSIQIGAYATSDLAQAGLTAYAAKSNDLLSHAQRIVLAVQSADGHTLFRARFGPFAEREARDTCAKLTDRGQTCFATTALPAAN